jgi:hypothetical protein
MTDMFPKIIKESNFIYFEDLRLSWQLNAYMDPAPE